MIYNIPKLQMRLTIRSKVFQETASVRWLLALRSITRLVQPRLAVLRRAVRVIVVVVVIAILDLIRACSVSVAVRVRVEVITILLIIIIQCRLLEYLIRANLSSSAWRLLIQRWRVVIRRVNAFEQAILASAQRRLSRRR